MLLNRAPFSCTKDHDEALNQSFLGYLLDDAEQTVRFVGLASPILLAYFLRHSGTNIDIEDLTQDCWARIHAARQRFRHGMPVLPWLLGVARHTRLDAYRKARIRTSLEVALGDDQQTAASVAIDMDEMLEAVKLLAHFKELTDAQQRILVLHYLKDLPQEEISKQLGCSIAAVKQKAFRARNALRIILNRREVNKCAA